MRVITSVDAQNRFGELLDQAQREPVGISRRGRTVAFVLSPQEYESLMHGAATPHSAKLLAAARAAVASFRGRGSGGATRRLLADRKAERDVSPAKSRAARRG